MPCRLPLGRPARLAPRAMSAAAAAGGGGSGLLAGSTFWLDSFALRQWDDPSFAGTRITHDKADFVARVEAFHAEGRPLVDGYVSGRGQEEGTAHLGGRAAGGRRGVQGTLPLAGCLAGLPSPRQLSRVAAATTLLAGAFLQAPLCAQLHWGHRGRSGHHGRQPAPAAVGLHAAAAGGARGADEVLGSEGEKGRESVWVCGAYSFFVWVGWGHQRLQWCFRLRSMVRSPPTPASWLAS